MCQWTVLIATVIWSSSTCSSSHFWRRVTEVGSNIQHDLQVIVGTNWRIDILHGYSNLHAGW